MNSLTLLRAATQNLPPVPVADDFQELLRRFERPLLQYATHILGDRERARDVVQETFLQLRHARREQVDNAPAKWLFTVCRNRALNVCRKERRMAYLDIDLLAQRESAAPSPQQEMEQSEARSFLLRILFTLPPRQQELLRLKFQHGLSYSDISTITHLSVSNVGVLMHNALKTLRQRYGAVAKEYLPFRPR